MTKASAGTAGTEMSAMAALMRFKFLAALKILELEYLSMVHVVIHRLPPTASILGLHSSELSGAATSSKDPERWGSSGPQSTPGCLGHRAGESHLQ